MNIFLERLIGESCVSEAVRTVKIDPAQLLRELRQHVVAVAGAARLAQDLNNSVLYREHRFEIQKPARKSCRRRDPASKFEVLQRVKDREDMGVLFLFFYRAVDLNSPHPVNAHLHGPFHDHSFRDAELLCIDDKYLPLKFLRRDTRALE